MSSDVFISYASEDRAIAEKICSGLEADGISCWIAPRNILPGDSYADAIIRGIDESAIFVLVFSGHANESPHIIREVERAVHKNAIIIPFLIENVKKNRDFEYYISAPHWLDATALPIENHIRKLIGTIKAQLIRRKPQESIISERSVQKREMFCGECGTLNPDTNRFCKNCGKPLGRIQPAVPASPSPVMDVKPEPHHSIIPISSWLMITIIGIIIVAFIIGIFLKAGNSSTVNPLQTIPAIESTVTTVPKITTIPTAIPTTTPTAASTIIQTITQPTGTRISGSILYNNEIITKYTKANVRIDLWDGNAKQTISDVQYDNQNGQYIFNNVPPGNYFIDATIETGYPYDRRSGGDYTSNLFPETPDIIVTSSRSEIRQDIIVKKIIRLTKPVDTQQERTMVNNPDKLYQSSYSPSAELFEWEAVPGATTYDVKFLKYEIGTQAGITQVSGGIVNTLQYHPNLQKNSPNQCYRLDIDAYNEKGEDIGHLENFYQNGWGSFEFIVM
jgi:hypothetical protein